MANSLGLSLCSGSQLVKTTIQTVRQKNKLKFILAQVLAHWGLNQKKPLMPEWTRNRILHEVKTILEFNLKPL